MKARPSVGSRAKNHESPFGLRYSSRLSDIVSRPCLRVGIQDEMARRERCQGPQYSTETQNQSSLQCGRDRQRRQGWRVRGGQPSRHAARPPRRHPSNGCSQPRHRPVWPLTSVRRARHLWRPLKNNRAPGYYALCRLPGQAGCVCGRASCSHSDLDPATSRARKGEKLFQGRATCFPHQASSR